MLGALLAVGLFAAPSFVSVASAQDAEPAAQEDATFDESLLEIPDGETGQFYIDRIQALGKAFNAYSEAQKDADAVRELQSRAQDTIAKLVKNVALADDLEYAVAEPYFRSYTTRIAREGNLDELNALLASEQSKGIDDTRWTLDASGKFHALEQGKDREVMGVTWLRYLVRRVSLDKAGAKGVDELKTAIKNLETDIAKQKDPIVVVNEEDEETHGKRTYEYAMPAVSSDEVEEYFSIISRYSPDEAKAFLQRVVEAFKASDSDVRQKLAVTLEPQLRFFNLVGNEMIFEGVYDDGTEIDWKSYRGKVVLVDFWATWCGPCVGEVPNVLALYEKYHDAGFDVVGYSLDNDLDALEKFEKERKLPWRTGVRKLSMQANEKDGKNYTNLTEYYGIHAIPTMILVDKDGKVISTEARGQRLQKLLEEAFPDVK